MVLVVHVSVCVCECMLLCAQPTLLPNFKSPLCIQYCDYYISNALPILAIVVVFVFIVDSIGKHTYVLCTYIDYFIRMYSMVASMISGPAATKS